MSLTLRKNSIKFAACIWSLLICGDPGKSNQTQVRSLTGALRRLQYSADCTTPLSPKPGKTPLHGRRFVCGYSLDPWPNLILDLKSYIPLLERHVITHMVAGRCNLQEEHSHPGYVLNSLLEDLAQTIVHNILFPATSAFMRPALPPRVAFFFSTAERAMKHCRSSGNICN